MRIDEVLNIIDHRSLVERGKDTSSNIFKLDTDFEANYKDQEEINLHLDVPKENAE